MKVYGGDKVPIVVDAGADLDSVKKASEQSFTSAKKAVEDYYVNAIGDVLAEENFRILIRPAGPGSRIWCCSRQRGRS